MKQKLHTDSVSMNNFIPFVQNASWDFFKVINLLHKDYMPAKKFYSNLIMQADGFESFLDDHCATNRKFIYLRELVSSVRNFAIITGETQHVLFRFSLYQLDETKEDVHSFRRDAEVTLSFLNRCMMILIGEVKEEAKKLGLKTPKTKLKCEIPKEISNPVFLPRNIIEDVPTVDAKNRLIDLIRRFRKVYLLFQEEGLGKRHDNEKVLQLLPFNGCSG